MSNAITASQALEQLKEGHNRYLMGCGGHVHTDAMRRQETSANGQHPFAAIVGCSDSRVPVEVLFDQGIGDLFVVRVPGNVCNADEIGAVEYGVEHLETPLCVMLGHTQCGAVTSVVNGAELHGHLANLVKDIHVAAAKAREDHPDLTGSALVEAATRINVAHSMANLIGNSPVVKERVEKRLLHVVGAIYDLASGAIEWCCKA